MPILWRYLIKSYLQVFLLTTFAFIAILLTSRLEEIAHFASFGADLNLIFFFILYQIPYILPIAIPLACLISSMLLMQRLCQDQELSSLRSAGFSVKELMAPLLFTSALLSLFNFYTTSELATESHLKTNSLKNELRSINPLLVLNNKHLMRVKGFYYESLGDSKMGQSASNIILAIPNQEKNSLNLIKASSLEVNDLAFTAGNLTIFTPLRKQGEQFSDILVESITKSSFEIQDFSRFVEKKAFEVTLDSLNLAHLLTELKEDKRALASLEKNAFNEPLHKSLQKSIRLAYSEIGRRISAGLSPLAFTLLGLGFGMSIGRERKKSNLIILIALGALYLFCFFAAKAAAQKPLFAYTLYLLPEALIIILSLYQMKKLAEGYD